MGLLHPQRCARYAQPLANDCAVTCCRPRVGGTAQGDKATRPRHIRYSKELNLQGPATYWTRP
jgi:hypothetical protein